MKKALKKKLLNLIEGNRKQDVLVTDYLRIQLLSSKNSTEQNKLKVLCNNYHLGDIIKVTSKAENRYDSYKFKCHHTFLKSCEKYGFIAEKEIKRSEIDEIIVIIDYLLVATAKLIIHYEYHEANKRFKNQSSRKALKGA